MLNQQDEAIGGAVPRAPANSGQETAPARRHPLDLHLDFDLGSRRYFLSIVGGCRHGDPAAEDVRRASRLGNILFLAAAGGSLLIVCVVLLSLAGALLEF